MNLMGSVIAAESRCFKLKLEILSSSIVKLEPGRVEWLDIFQGIAATIQWNKKIRSIPDLFENVLDFLFREYPDQTLAVPAFSVGKSTYTCCRLPLVF